MKIKTTVAALLSALTTLSYTAQADARITPSEYIENGDTIDTDFGDGKGIAKTGEGTATITGDTTTAKSSLFVQEGTLQVGDAEGERTTLHLCPSTTATPCLNDFTIAGKNNATMSISNADVTGLTDGTYNYVGSIDGSGQLIIEKESIVNLYRSAFFCIGYKMGYPQSYCNDAYQPDGTDYQGDYVDKGEKGQFAKGIVTVKEGSSFTVGYSTLWLSEGELNIIGQGTDPTKSKTNVQLGWSGQGSNIITGLGDNSESAINITDGGSLTLYVNHAYFAHGKGAKSVINIDGAGSVLTLNQHADSAISTYFGCDVNAESIINVTNKGKLELNTHAYVYLGCFSESVKSTINVDKDSEAVIASDLYATTSSTVNNSGKFNAANIVSYDGSTINNDGELTTNSLHLFSGSRVHNEGTLSTPLTMLYDSPTIINDGTLTSPKIDCSLNGDTGCAITNNGEINATSFSVQAGTLNNHGSINAYGDTELTLFVLINSVVTNHAQINGAVVVAQDDSYWGEGTFIAKKGSFAGSLTVATFGTYVAEGDNSTDNMTVRGNATVNEGTTLTANQYIEVTGNGTLTNKGTINAPFMALYNDSSFTNQGTAKTEVYVCDNSHMEAKDGSRVGDLIVMGGTVDVEKHTTVDNSLQVHSGTINLNMANSHKTKAAISVGGTAEVKQGSNLTIAAGSQNLKAGIKYILINKEIDPALANITLVGLNGTVTTDNGQTILTLTEDLYLGRDSRADAAIAAAWGVYKSTQAFTETLWQPREEENCVEIKQEGTDSRKKTAWASIYSDNSRIGSHGADYSVYGAAIGVESELSARRAIGLAIGYDFGKNAPYNTSAVDRSSMHLGVYGRAYAHCFNSTDMLAIDWSATCGSTTSEHDNISGEWKQNSLQLDARATYYRALSDHATANAFVGAQYYAQNSDTTGGIKAAAIQNLRFMLGGGISYRVNKHTTLYGEAMLYGDTMRHDPTTSVDDFFYTGTNPGRIGGSISAGAQYRINDQWSLRANYSFSSADDETGHHIGIGASYRF